MLSRYGSASQEMARSQSHNIIGVEPWQELRSFFHANPAVFCMLVLEELSRHPTFNSVEYTIRVLLGKWQMVKSTYTKFYIFLPISILKTSSFKWGVDWTLLCATNWIVL